MKPVLIFLAAAALLSACGKQGALERPDPIFSHPAPSEPAQNR